jgi:lyso-ornithine lipid O-acyltransferase
MTQGLAGLRVFGIVVIAAFVAPLQILATWFHKPTARRVPYLFHKGMLSLVRMKVRAEGAPSGSAPVLFISNHASYLDVIVLGSLTPGCFVAKSEVATWPFFGWLAKLGRTVFVERGRRALSHHQRDTLIGHLADGDSIFLFPEGTSNDGNQVGTFKSTLLAAAEAPLPSGALPMVQPVVVAYTGIYGLPMARRQRPKFAWFGDMDLMPHLFELMQVGPCEVDVRFLKPVQMSDFTSRKDLTNYCYEEISQTLSALLQGRA